MCGLQTGARSKIGANCCKTPKARITAGKDSGRTEGRAWHCLGASITRQALRLHSSILCRRKWTCRRCSRASPHLHTARGGRTQAGGTTWVLLGSKTLGEARQGELLWRATAWVLLRSKTPRGGGSRHPDLWPPRPRLNGARQKLSPSSCLEAVVDLQLIRKLLASETLGNQSLEPNKTRGSLGFARLKEGLLSAHGGVAVALLQLCAKDKGHLRISRAEEPVSAHQVGKKAHGGQTLRHVPPLQNAALWERRASTPVALPNPKASTKHRCTGLQESPCL